MKWKIKRKWKQNPFSQLRIILKHDGNIKRLNNCMHSVEAIYRKCFASNPFNVLKRKKNSIVADKYIRYLTLNRKHTHLLECKHVKPPKITIMYERIEARHCTDRLFSGFYHNHIRSDHFQHIQRIHHIKRLNL